MADYRRIWCFADGGPDGWEAFCPDFDLAVEGDTFEHVKSTLNEMIESYVQCALAEEPHTTRRLLNRKAPWLLRLKCSGRLLAHALLNGGDGDNLRAGFDVRCHA